MSREAEDNPAYITVVRMNREYHLNMMKWDDRAGDYQVYDTHHIKPLTLLEAQTGARQWAAEEGLEVR